jgi:hypothetical protein
LQQLKGKVVIMRVHAAAFEAAEGGGKVMMRAIYSPDRPAGQAAPPPHHHASPGIPQLDGSMFDNTHEQASLNVTSYGEWSCKCCMYETFFDTEDMLKHHHDENHDFIEYEECNLCYTGHVWDSRS